jgi:hypothetical protein
MFGFSSFAEAPFSALVTTGGVWNEIREVADNWRQIDPTESTFLVRASNGIEYQASLRVLSSSAVQYVVPRVVLTSSGTSYIPVTNLWQDSTSSSNSWVEV